MYLKRLRANMIVDKRLTKVGEFLSHTLSDPAPVL